MMSYDRSGAGQPRRTRVVAVVFASALVMVAAAACVGPRSDQPTTTPASPSGRSQVPTSTAAALPDPPDPAVLVAQLDELTAYDVSAPFDLTVDGEPTEGLGGAIVRDVSWASPAGGRVTAWLVEPPASVAVPYAGLVYVHGSETDRDDLRDEAAAMASVGAVCLVIDAPFARPGGSRDMLQSYDDPDTEVAMTAQAIVDVRRAYDVLTARDDVDPTRLGFVGHSWGASIGIDVAAVDDRPIAYALLSPRPSWTAFLRESDARWVAANRRIVGDAAWGAYLVAMAPFDGLPQIGRVPGERILLQYGDSDDVVPPAVADQLVGTAPVGTTTQRFADAGHALDAAAIRARTAWLAARLGLPTPAADTLAHVGLPDF